MGRQINLKHKLMEKLLTATKK